MTTLLQTMNGNRAQPRPDGMPMSRVEASCREAERGIGKENAVAANDNGKVASADDDARAGGSFSRAGLDTGCRPERCVDSGATRWTGIMSPAGCAAAQSHRDCVSFHAAARTENEARGFLAPAPRGRVDASLDKAASQELGDWQSLSSIVSALLEERAVVKPPRPRVRFL